MLGRTNISDEESEQVCAAALGSLPRASLLFNLSFKTNVPRIKNAATRSFLIFPLVDPTLSHTPRFPREHILVGRPIVILKVKMRETISSH